jgi:hypothetical protein
MVLDLYLELIGSLSLLLTALGTYLAFFVCPSDTWLREFAIWSDRSSIDLKSKSSKKNAIKRFIYSNGLRSGLLLILFFIIIPLLTSQHGGVRFLLSNRLYQLGTLLMVVYTLGWALYFGPKRLSKKFQEPLSFRKHFLPYICDIPTLFAPMVILAPLIVAAVVLSLSQDYQLISSDYAGLLNTVSVTQCSNLIELQKKLMEIITFGQRLSEITQKYITVGILALIYAIAEQKTYMRLTIVKESIDKIKLAAYFILIISFIFGILILPDIYSHLYNQFDLTFSEKIDEITTYENAIGVLLLFGEIEKYDVGWFYKEVLTGYGNLISFTIIGTAILLRTTIFKNISLEDIFKIFLPQRAFDVLMNFFVNIGIDLSDNENG